MCSVPMWSNCDDMTLAYFTSYVDHLLQYVTIPYDALHDTTRDKVLINFIQISVHVCQKQLKMLFHVVTLLFLISMCPAGTLMLLRNTRRPERPIWPGWTWASQDLGITLII